MKISLDQLKAIGAIVATVLTGAIVIWWLVIVANRIGLKAEVDASGNVVLDQYGWSKDILLVVLPLFSAALAYWVGSSGTQDAKKEAANAKQEAAGAKQQLEAVIDTSPRGSTSEGQRGAPGRVGGDVGSRECNERVSRHRAA